MGISVFQPLRSYGPGDTNTIIRQVEEHVGDYAEAAARAAYPESEVAANHRRFSRVASVGARDALSWNDRLANLSSPWETSGSPTVSGGKAYAATGGPVNSVALRPITFGNRFRYIVPVDFKDGIGTSRFSGIVATESTAATVAANDMSRTVSISIDAATGGTNRNVFVNAFTINASLGVLPAGNRQLIMGMVWDDRLGLGVFCRTPDGSFDKSDWVNAPDMNAIPWKPTRVGFFSIDNRGSASATGYGPFGFRASHATIEPRLGVEGVGASVHFGAPTNPTNAERTRIAAPASYDSKTSSRLLIVCHGGGQDVYHGKDLGDYYLINGGMIVASGDFRGLSNSMYAFGAPASVDRVVELYEHVLERYHVGSVFVAGYSMGGQTALQVAADGRIPGIKGVIVGNPAVDLKWVWQQRAQPVWSTNWAAVKAAWGVGSDAESAWDAATAALNPMTRPVTDFRGIPIWMSSSPDDDTAIEEFNTLPFRDRVNAVVPGQVTHHVATGDHGDLSAWPQATIKTWMDALALT